jgi:hypothetical protein
MTMLMAALMPGLAVVLALAGGASQEPAPKKVLVRPPDWVVRHDPGGAADALYFVGMPPGWHITTGPGTILYHPARTGQGRFRVEAEIFLFPGTSDGVHGLFLAGRTLDDAEGPSYAAFLVRRDGGATRGHCVKGKRAATPFTTAPAGVAAVGAKEPVKNVLVVEVDGNVATFLVNGRQVAKETANGPAGPWDGVVGLRIDPDVNLHMTRLDVTPLGEPGRR